MSDFPRLTLPMENMPSFTITALMEIDAKVTALTLQFRNLVVLLTQKDEKEIQQAFDETLQFCQKEIRTQYFAKYGGCILPPESPR